MINEADQELRRLVEGLQHRSVQERGRSDDGVESRDGGAHVVDGVQSDAIHEALDALERANQHQARARQIQRELWRGKAVCFAFIVLAVALSQLDWLSVALSEVLR